MLWGILAISNTDSHLRVTMWEFLIRWMWILVEPVHVSHTEQVYLSQVQVFLPFDLGTNQSAAAQRTTWAATTFYYSSLMVYVSHIQNDLQCSWLWLTLITTTAFCWNANDAVSIWCYVPFVTFALALDAFPCLVVLSYEYNVVAVQIIMFSSLL